MFGGTKVRIIICVWLTSLILLSCTGCQQQQQPAALYVDAVTLKEAGQDKKAVEKLKKAVKLNEHFSLAYSLLGEIYQEMEDYERSAASYEKATQTNPLSFKDYYNLGWAYQIMEKFAPAAKAYNRACELKPDHLGAHLNATLCYYEIMDYDNALIYGRRTEQISPNINKIHKLLGDIYTLHEHYDQAVVAYEHALKIDNKNTEIVISLAVAHLQSGSYKSAKELLISVTQVQPHNNTAYRHLGHCYLQLNEPDKAIESYSRAIEIDDKDWQAHQRLGDAYMLSALNKNNTVLIIKAVEQWRLSLAVKPNQLDRERLLKLIRQYSP